uniref:N-acetyltransferase domain-containing protein n=1 Tax=Oryza barthii TaxID=65489 RepID=A0A0D3FM47_9ORYZ
MVSIGSPPQLSSPVKLGCFVEVYKWEAETRPDPATEMEAEAEAAEVTLREFTEADAEALFAWASDPRVVRFQRRDAYSHVDEARRYIVDKVLPHPWYRAICVAGADRPVGSISVLPHPWYRAICVAGADRPVGSISVNPAAVADVENPASQRVLEKAGFAREGVLRRYVVLKGRPRDMVMFSRVRADFEEKPAQAHGPSDGLAEMG